MSKIKALQQEIKALKRKDAEVRKILNRDGLFLKESSTKGMACVVAWKAFGPDKSIQMVSRVKRKEGGSR